MDGSEVFKFAVRIMEQGANRVMQDCRLTMEDIKLIIPHQANIRILEGAAKRLNAPMEKIFPIFINMETYHRLLFHWGWMRHTEKKCFQRRQPDPSGF